MVPAVQIFFHMRRTVRRVAGRKAVGLGRHPCSPVPRGDSPPHESAPAKRAFVTEDDLLSFVTASIRSVWALELLLLLKRDPARSWDAESLIRELRSSPVVIADALASLVGAGLVIDENGVSCRYGAASATLDQLVIELGHVYAV